MELEGQVRIRDWIMREVGAAGREANPVTLVSKGVAMPPEEFFYNPTKQFCFE